MTTRLTTLKSLDLSIIYFSLRDDPEPPLGGVRMKAVTGLRPHPSRAKTQPIQYQQAVCEDTGSCPEDVLVYKVAE